MVRFSLPIPQRVASGLFFFFFGWWGGKGTKRVITSREEENAEGWEAQDLLYS